MPELPTKRYVRRGDIMAYLGIDKREMSKLVGTVFTPLYLRGQGRAFFLRAQVIEAEASGKIFKPSKSPSHES